MRLKALLFLSATLAVSLHADILLDQVMTRDEQRKTGVANLSVKQKIALEAWLNDNFVLKNQPNQKQQAPLTISINIDDGQKLQLSDNSIWEISPDDVPTASVWITPVAVKIVPSNDPNYPSMIINTVNKVGVKARQVSSGSQMAPTSAGQ